MPTCPNCSLPLRFLSKESLQLGKTGWLLGDLPNLLAGALTVDIFLCPQCRRLEFYLAEEEDEDDSDSLPQVTCPKCGAVHDFDDPRCPKCGHSLYGD